jgi:F-type H+-transporting ATPase subunit epsilon
MNLKVLLPFQVFAEKTDVLRVIAETADGSFGLLPRRRDCVAALEPGILTYETAADGTVYVAIDQGVLVKFGAESVKREFLTLNNQERDVRAAVARMEGSFMRHLEEFTHER